ncbi:MAG: ECF-type sigma factor, partial [Verrucomicrobiales bacterium]|nr:ECF-type sigma factor [Verrucomicrobiales bacterium]
MNEATRVLRAIDKGDAIAASELLPLVYNELRHLAAQQLSNELLGNTLQPTALVHEAWLRLVGHQTATFENRAHFFAAAAEAMRRILIERARRRRALKRGGDAQFEPFDLERTDVAVDADDQTLLLVNEAIEKLAGEDEETANLIKLRFFIGMTNQEAGRALGISERTAKRHWTFA